MAGVGTGGAGRAVVQGFWVVQDLRRRKVSKVVSVARAGGFNHFTERTVRETVSEFSFLAFQLKPSSTLRAFEVVRRGIRWE